LEPPSLPPSAPLVVVLHGSGQTAEAYAVGSGWAQLAAENGFGLLCPEQTSSNNGTRSFQWFNPGDTTRGHGEAASINAMIEDVLRRGKYDPARVFVTGLSSGGAMTVVMLATYPERFAAGAVIGGLPYGAATNVMSALWTMRLAKRLPAREWGDKVRSQSTPRSNWPPVTVWHGNNDNVVSSGNGAAVAEQWADVHGVTAPPTTAAVEPDHTAETWCAPNGEPKVVLHTIAGMGHGKALKTGGSDGCGKAGPYLLEVGISSARQIATNWALVPVKAHPKQTAA
jgi:poly(hydroxyalkanoate) depolymerase family esterase